jgi:hypothetical protein
VDREEENGDISDGDLSPASGRIGLPLV